MFLHTSQSFHFLLAYLDNFINDCVNLLLSNMQFRISKVQQSLHKSVTIPFIKLNLLSIKVV